MKDYRLVFEDTFEKEGALDKKHYRFEVGNKWFNNEQQCYVDDNKHAFVKNHQLHLVATKGTGSCPYESARINTQGLHEWTYGRFVIRAKLPEGHGSWPALWFLGASHSHGTSWPLCGEIDLMEQSGHTPQRIHFSLHTHTYNHLQSAEKQRTFTTQVKTATAEFHDYEMEWTPEKIDFLVDGKLIGGFSRKPGDTTHEWPFDQPFYLIMNIAVGGFMGGDIHDDELPFEMIVDSIRVYQRL